LRVSPKSGDASYKGPGVRLRGTGSLNRFPKIAFNIWLDSERLRRGQAPSMGTGSISLLMGHAIQASSPDFPNGDILRRLTP
jgi:hypothetical protein